MIGANRFFFKPRWGGAVVQWSPSKIRKSIVYSNDNINPFLSISVLGEVFPRLCLFLQAAHQVAVLQGIYLSIYFYVCVYFFVYLFVFSPVSVSSSSLLSNSASRYLVYTCMAVCMFVLLFVYLYVYLSNHHLIAYVYFF